MTMNFGEEMLYGSEREKNRHVVKFLGVVTGGGSKV